MKRLTLSGLILIAAAAAGCTTGPYAFFRHDQHAVNQQYTQQVMAKQGMSDTAVGGTQGSGGGAGAGYGR